MFHKKMINIMLAYNVDVQNNKEKHLNCPKLCDGAPWGAAANSQSD